MAAPKRSRGRPKGTPKTGGRTKGVVNKITGDLKGSVMDAFGKLGGVAYLVTVGKEDPKTFCALLGKLLPMQVGSDPENPLAVIMKSLDGLTSGIPANH